MTTRAYTVRGMSCEHCVSSVTSQLSTVPGVSDVQIDLGAGQVTVIGDGPIDDGAVRAAVDEAGYEVAR